MTPLYYSGEPSLTRPAAPVELPPMFSRNAREPADYLPDAGLVDAVNVALVLRQPLLLTGEPGTGKSDLAASLAWELGLLPPLVFEGKSTSQARDLFYGYDTLGRFTSRDAGGALPARDYLSFNALGEAIVRTQPPEALADVLPDGFERAVPRRSVVLMDEIEKTPRDFPNDILNEIERMYFRIPELGNRRIEADPALHPVVVMTNNSEKMLPDAFLRRCVYYNIPFPKADRLERIVLTRLRLASPATPLLRDAIDFFLQLRDEATGLTKKPGTAELLNWLSALHVFGADPARNLAVQSGFAGKTFSALGKLAEDQGRIGSLFADWARGQGDAGAG